MPHENDVPQWNIVNLRTNEQRVPNAAVFALLTVPLISPDDGLVVGLVVELVVFL
jgi:hypothetical protein